MHIKQYSNTTKKRTFNLHRDGFCQNVKCLVISFAHKNYSRAILQTHKLYLRVGINSIFLLSRFFIGVIVVKKYAWSQLLKYRLYSTCGGNLSSSCDRVSRDTKTGLF